MKKQHINMKWLSICLVWGIILILATNVHAQENDFQIWGDISLKYKLNKKFKVQAEFGLRSRENSRLLNQQYVEAGGRYKLKKYFSLAAKYRFTDYYSNSKSSAHRVQLDLYFQKKWKRIRWALRERYQYQWFLSDYKNIANVQTLRTRIQLAYNVKKSKMEPFVAVEHYWGLNGKYLWLTKQMRWTLGLEHPLNKWSDIAIAYRIQREYYKANPLTSYIFLVSYKISIK